MKKVVIIGAGFAGLNFARRLKNSEFEVTLLDRYNYHQFQPLFYQVATAGLEPSAISFPLRKIFQGYKNFHIRTCEVTGLDTEQKVVLTNICNFHYDILIIATGADTNYFGLKQVEEHAIPMKSVGEALYLRNHILQRFEYAVAEGDAETRKALLTFIIVGGGPTGVEVAGALAEMRNYVLHKDYPELNFDHMEIMLVEAGPKVLGVMSEEASAKSKQFLENLGVKVMVNTQMKGYDGNQVEFGSGEKINCKTLIWAAGVKGNVIEGIKPDVVVKNRIKVDRFNKVEGYGNIYAIGDIAMMETTLYPKGHPQLANVAINQGKLLAENLKAMSKGKPMKRYEYKDPGSMATVGRNLAVVDFPRLKLQGFFAWVLWMTVHLMLILGVKNKIFIFLDWAWNYVSHDPSLRLIIRPSKRKGKPVEEVTREKIQCGEIVE
jgi:NADH:ubiquinone reductase (H+-translocating)